MLSLELNRYSSKRKTTDLSLELIKIKEIKRNLINMSVFKKSENLFSVSQSLKMFLLKGWYSLNDLITAPNCSFYFVFILSNTKFKRQKKYKQRTSQSMTFTKYLISLILSWFVAFFIDFLDAWSIKSNQLHIYNHPNSHWLSSVYS